jgi:hypothetical protein
VRFRKPAAAKLTVPYLMSIPSGLSGPMGIRSKVRRFARPSESFEQRVGFLDRGLTAAAALSRQRRRYASRAKTGQASCGCDSAFPLRGSIRFGIFAASIGRRPAASICSRPYRNRWSEAQSCRYIQTVRAEDATGAVPLALREWEDAITGECPDLQARNSSAHLPHIGQRIVEQELDLVLAWAVQGESRRRSARE